MNKKTYLIIAHNRDALDNEIKSCALDHELDEFNTGNALAERSSFGLHICNSIQAMTWKSAALLNTHFEGFKKYEFFHMEFISLNIVNLRASKCLASICF